MWLDSHVTGSESSHTNYESHFVDLKFKEATSDLSIESKRYTNTWHKVSITGDALTLWLNDFSFNEPFVQFLRSDFYACQFGGLFLRAGSYSTDAHTIPQQNHMSICSDDISPLSVLVLGANLIYVYVLYLVGYSEGSITLNIRNKKHVKAHILQGCSEKEDPCILQHDIWNEMGTSYISDSISYIKQASSINLELFTFFLINPPVRSHLQENSISHTSKVLHVTAGSRKTPISLGVVHIFIGIANTKSLTSCVNKLIIHVLNNFNNSDDDYISVSQVSPSNKTYVVPSASYINVMIHTCPNVQNEGHEMITLQMEKHKVCGEMEMSPWVHQIRDNCQQLILPYNLGSASFYTNLFHAYEVTIGDACVDKSSLDISIAGYIPGTMECALAWDHIDISASPIKISFHGKMNITWTTKQSCIVADTNLTKCNLNVAIVFEEPPDSFFESHYKRTEMTADQTILHSNSRKDIIFHKE